MKLQVTLVLISVLLFEALQTSAALTCTKCEGLTCTHTNETCSTAQDRCYTQTVDKSGQKTKLKGCTTKAECDKAESLFTCCEKDLCNSGGASNYAGGVKLMILGPLLISILFV